MAQPVSSRRKFLSLLGLAPIAPIAAGLAVTFPRGSLSTTRTVLTEHGCEFGAFTGVNSAHMHLYGPCILKNFADYTISGGAQRHVFLEGQSALDNESSEVTLTGAPVFAAYLHVAAQSHAVVINMKFTGTAAGTRYIREGGYIGVFPAQELNKLLPGDQIGLDRGPDNFDRGAA